MNKGKWFLKCLVGGFVFILLAGALTMVLWNWLVPDLFHLPELRFFEALGLLLLTRILFGGWGGRGWGNGGGRHWKHKYYEKLSSMSIEERERFKSRMREKWCSAGSEKKTDNVGSHD